jgi:hypothetical protein
MKNQKRKTKQKTDKKVADTDYFAKFVQDVAEIHVKVTDIYCTAQHYKNIKKNFMERISVANSAVNILQKRKDLFTPYYFTSLQRLVRVLQNMIKFVKETQYNEFLKAKTIKKKFISLSKEYDNSINLLNFFDFKKFNAQEEDKILKEDIEEFLKFQTVSTKNTIAKILDEVEKLCKMAQHNKNIAEILKERISKANLLVENLQQNNDLLTSNYDAGINNLRRLKQVIQNMKKFIEEITMQKLLEAETIEEKFKDLNNEYVTSVSNLNVKFKFNAQEENKIILSDLVIYSIAKINNDVKELYIMAQYNKKIIVILVKRISKVHSVVRQAREDLITSQLQSLVQVLKKMKSYIEEISYYDIEQDFSKAIIIKNKFKDLREEYNNNIYDLKFDNCKKFNTKDEDKVLEEPIKFQAILAESINGTNMNQISEVTTSIYFELFVPLVKDVTNIFNRSMDLYRKVQHKKITKILIDRITTAANIVNIYILQDVDDNLHTSKNHVNLQRLVQILEDMKKFIAERLLQDKLPESVESQITELFNKCDKSIKMIDPKLNVEKESKNLKEEFQAASTDTSNHDMDQSVSDTNDKMNKIIKQVREMSVTMKSLVDDEEGINQEKIDNVFNEFSLPFEDYKETDDKSQSDKLKKYIHEKTKDKFAFKIVEKEHIIQVRNQVTILKKLEYCQNIIHFFGLTYDRANCYLITEWAENGNLREYISLHGQNIEIKFRLKFACDIAKGLSFLNAVKVIN